jgi:curli biogenesis system outer membrane secretion channel CsgG
MNRTVLAVLITAALAACQQQAPTPTAAASPPAAPEPTVAPKPTMAEISRRCSTYSSLANKIMEARQGGVSMAEQMKIMADDEIAQRLVVMAYEQPRYSTDRVQSKTIVDFENTVHLTCIQEASQG